MSVYTLLTLDSVQPFVAAYGLPVATTLEPIKGGIENSNYFLTLADGRKLVLTLFEELSGERAAFLAPLLCHLNSVGLPVAAPLTDRQGHRLTTLAGKPAQLAPRLAGRHPDTPDMAQCRAMGAALARLHLGLRDYPLQRANNHGPAWWSDVAARWLPRLAADDAQLLTSVQSRYAHICARYPDLPRGLIHGDLFRDNTLFCDDTVTALLDFSETSDDHWLLDIAITSNDFCRHWPNNRPDQTRRSAFLDGYDAKRPLTAAERTALPDFLAVGAMRFWLSRLDVALRNAEEGRHGEHVLEKNPAEMRTLCVRLLAEAS